MECWDRFFLLGWQKNAEKLLSKDRKNVKAWAEDSAEVNANKNPDFGSGFKFNPETLSPVHLKSLLLTDAYLVQTAVPGAALISSDWNVERGPNRIIEERYEVLT
ncbi:hypothetical protein SynBIOSE41_03764 [Synechococcus sp. BIOS-E4-1]|uniref:hypothetical protein n=1 Tax=Synechococcus sp. BIOS-E4-1 TaxID=1400864 RepID=UPI0016467FB9|nr:hypothetical protein [Synechococcus sp. BIOS-E4-1]QNI56233.1 hypothetical protein SynBIOSE41_03764 [Synechococcus sp. BIOS-E4-1]